MWQRAAQRIRLMALAAAAFVLILLPFMDVPKARADFLTNRSDEISDSHINASATHLFSFTINNLATPLGSIQFQFCSNTPIPEDPCTVPVGLDMSAIFMPVQTGNTGFTIHPSSTNNNLILTRFPSLPLGGPSSYQINNVTNPSNAGSYYVRIRTFASTDATGAWTEEAGVVFAIVNSITLTAEVPPYLNFCVAVSIVPYDCSTASAFFIDMGDFSKTKATTASSEFLVSTNAGFGFTVSIDGTTLTSGVNTIPALAVQTASAPGTSQFGINLRANSSPGVGADPIGPGLNGTVDSNYGTPNQFRFVPGDPVMTSTGSSDFRKYTVSYLANISAAQSIGFYATTVSFICLANF